MRKSPIVVVLLIAGAALGASSFADEPKVEGDLKSLQGEWVSKDSQGESFWTFKGNHLSIKTPDRAYEITITLDPKQTPEKHIDFEVLDDSPNAKGTKAAGIYKLDGEEVKIAFAGPDAERPTEYKTDPVNSFAFELKKKKK
ncbi:TIGR03067 domain-containing protein [Paludisphaera borealis]|uniref:TIGR03067 domain-containing protein n=1 Tax=Paludisphaera borealis TaxID=1387353 RepID=A0A1U7CT89_9BACT|nr:TIGR03067 domain-containing protein [Paludisphaera borealis]APW62109.1 hypothetical protein BSF38_03641 [Paludisphaera borealis]